MVEQQDSSEKPIAHFDNAHDDLLHGAQLLVWLSSEQEDRLRAMLHDWYSGSFAQNIEKYRDLEGISDSHRKMLDCGVAATRYLETVADQAADVTIAHLRNSLLISGVVLSFTSIDYAVTSMITKLLDNRPLSLLHVISESSIRIGDIEELGYENARLAILKRKVEKLERESVFKRLVAITGAMPDSSFTRVVNGSEFRDLLGELKGIRESVVHHGVSKIEVKNVKKLITHAIVEHGTICTLFDDAYTQLADESARRDAAN